MNAVLTANRPSPSRPPTTGRPSARRLGGWGDTFFKNLTLIFALSILVIAAAIAWQLWKNSALSRHAFGWKFLTQQIWDPVAEHFGALPFVYGTLVSSAIALII